MIVTAILKDIVIILKKLCDINISYCLFNLSYLDSMGSVAL